MGTDEVSQLVRGIAITMLEAGLPPGIMHVGVDEAGQRYVDVLDRATLTWLARVYSDSDYGTVLEAGRALLNPAAAAAG